MEFDFASCFKVFATMVSIAIVVTAAKKVA